MNKNVGGLVGDDIDRPADIVLLFEADAPIRSYSGGLIDVTKERHYGYSNIAFVDGHVKKFNAIGLQALVWLPEKVKLQQ